MKILLVDDDFAVKNVVANLIKEIASDIEIDYADNGKDGLCRFASSKYDLLVVDIFMPIMDGLDMIDLLPKNVHVIAYTGYDIKDFDASRLVGRAQLLYKYEIRALVNRVKEIYKMISMKHNAQKLYDAFDKLYTICAA